MRTTAPLGLATSAQAGGLGPRQWELSLQLTPTSFLEPLVDRLMKPISIEADCVLGPADTGCLSASGRHGHVSVLTFLGIVPSASFALLSAVHSLNAVISQFVPGSSPSCSVCILVPR